MRGELMLALIRPLITLAAEAYLIFLRVFGSRKTAVGAARNSETQLRQKHFAGAEYMARSAIAADPHWLGGYKALANVYSSAGDVSGARAVLQRAANEIRGDGEVDAALGDLEREAGRYAGAEEAYRRGLKSGARSPHMLVRLARALEGQGKLDEAATLLEEARQLAPDDLSVLTALGEVRTEQGQYQDAVAPLTEVVEREPGRAFPHFYLGVALRNIGRTEEALSQLATAVHLDPTNERYLDYVRTVQG
jgi:tetratricopeptide (TPR) repeat protein